jgi:hypothetical protein
MKLLLTLKSLEDLHEDLHDLYKKQDDGSFNLIPPEGFINADDVEDTAGLKSALNKTRDEKRELARKLKSTAEKFAGIDLDEFEKLKGQETDAATAKLEAAGEWDKIKDQMITANDEVVAGKNKEIARLTGQLERVQVDSKVVEAISKAGGNVELLKPHVRQRLQLNTDDFSTTVLDSDMKTPKVDGDGNPVTIDDLISEMRKSETYAGAFKASDQSGSGSEPGKGSDGPTGGSGGKPKVNAGDLKRSTMTERQKVDFQKEHGLDALLDLPL